LGTSINNNKTILFFLLVFFFLLYPRENGFSQTGLDSDSVETDSSSNNNNYFSIKGIERDEKRSDRFLRGSLNTVLFIPRVAFDIVLRSAGYSTALLDEKNIVKSFENFFYLYERKLGWYPLFNIVTGSPHGFGAAIFYKDNYFGAVFKGAYSNDYIWGLKGDISYTFFKSKYVWKLKLTGRVQNDDNYRFYGIGPNPKTDPRSYFLPGTDQLFGFFFQRRVNIDFNLGVRPSANWEVFLTLFFQKRNILEPRNETPSSIQNVFDVENLPGFRVNSKKIYGELSFVLDTREFLDIIEPGVRSEVYLGLARGTFNDDNRLLRTGVDFSAFIPLIRNNRLFVPRVVFNVTENFEDEPEISFVDYPRQPSFRGVSNRQLYRNDNYSLLTSLEYHWPLTLHVSGILFADHWMISPALPRMSVSNAPRAIGIGINMHTRHTEIGRALLSYGTEGVFAQFSFGFSTLYKDRTDWQ
jgi:hypothetical protein